MSELLLDRAGRRRSPATMPGFRAGHAPGNKGLRYPADPPKVEEIIAVMRTAGDDAHGRRLRGLIVILWRAGLRIQEALALAESDLDPRRGALLVRRGKAAGAAKSVWTPGAGGAAAVARAAPAAARRATALRHQRADLRPALDKRRGTSRPAPHSRRGRRATALRAAPAPARPCRRARARRRATNRHPAAARPQQPRHHLGLPPGHRQRRNHRNRPRPPPADDPGQHIPAALT